MNDPSSEKRRTKDISTSAKMDIDDEDDHVLMRTRSASLDEHTKNKGAESNPKDIDLILPPLALQSDRKMSDPSPRSPKERKKRLTKEKSRRRSNHPSIQSNEGDEKPSEELKVVEEDNQEVKKKKPSKKMQKEPSKQNQDKVIRTLGMKNADEYEVAIVKEEKMKEPIKSMEGLNLEDPKVEELHRGLEKSSSEKAKVGRSISSDAKMQRDKKEKKKKKTKKESDKESRRNKESEPNSPIKSVVDDKILKEDEPEPSIPLSTSSTSVPTTNSKNEQHSGIESSGSKSDSNHSSLKDSFEISIRSKNANQMTGSPVAKVQKRENVLTRALSFTSLNKLQSSISAPATTTTSPTTPTPTTNLDTQSYENEESTDSVVVAPSPSTQNSEKPIISSPSKTGSLKKDGKESSQGFKSRLFNILKKSGGVEKEHKEKEHKESHKDKEHKELKRSNEVEEEKPRKNQFAGQTLDVRKFEDLPKDLQRSVKDAKITNEEVEQHFEILLSILAFQTKIKFTITEELKAKAMASPVALPPPKTTLIRPNMEPEDLIRSENPKEIYKIMREEGKGGFGRVFKGCKKEDERVKVAIKVMHHANEKDKRWNVGEFGFLQFCKHPNVVKYYCCHECEGELWGIMEFLEGGTLDQAVKQYTFQEKQIAYVAREMLKGLEFIHSENLVHRDLKSANVMMSTRGEIKLIDFGLCVDMSDGMKNSMVGSPFWMPPEMIQRKLYDCKVDIWSLGVCLMELANGHAPNNKSALRAMMNVGINGHPEPLEKPKLWSTAFREFLTLCLKMNPKERPTAAQLLQHEFLEKADSSKSMRKIISGIFVLQTVLPF